MAGAERLQDGPVAALATPLGTSALAVIRLSGAGCLDLLARGFTSPARLLAAPGHSLVYGKVGPAGQPIDEVMVGVYRAPRSYTGEDMAEVFCHGSVPGIQALLAFFLALGFRLANPGEFTLRAFLNGKMDLSRAEAVHEMVSAQTRAAQSQALKRLEGGVERAVNRFKDQLVDLMALISAQLDYPEEEVEETSLDPGLVRELRAGLDRLAATYSSGRLYQAGVRVALAGRTNAGKSSLFNALVREERAIVSDIHGTTRDWLEAPFELKGIPVRLFDTAGLREAQEVIEQEGIRRSGMVIDSASLVLYLVDGCSGLDADEAARIQDFAARGVRVLLLWTKADAPGWQPPPALPWAGALAGPVLGLSARDHGDLGRLLGVMEALVRPADGAEEAAVLIDSERQYQLLRQAVAALDHVLEGIEAGLSLDLVGLDVQEALAALGQITGEVRTEDILDRVFSTFCLGK